MTTTGPAIHAWWGGTTAAASACVLVGRSEVDWTVIDRPVVDSLVVDTLGYC
jgi:hypothetical protein